MAFYAAANAVSRRAGSVSVPRRSAFVDGDGDSREPAARRAGLRGQFRLITARVVVKRAGREREGERERLQRQAVRLC